MWQGAELSPNFPEVFVWVDTAGNKIIRALEVIRVKISYLMLLYEINISQATLFIKSTVYRKHELIKTCNQNRENLQMLE